eukprot:TRINITY_DN3152_c0_g1_i1.p1 TRINITY_DN3152_c0_g1~~TRINITY_DN3152_c0_g1_i1.p1  ORF type:complete len:291 (-),score=69.54 TRINITY_DN3152_c0_g1_i1:52-924(-)
MGTLVQLPEEVIVECVLGRLDAVSLCACERVCRAWRAWASSDRAWRCLLAADYPQHVAADYPQVPRKEVYRELWLHLRWARCSIGPYDHLLRFALCGSANSGKSTLLSAMADPEDFDFKQHTAYMKTIGIDFKIISLYNSHTKLGVKCQMWDLAGDPRFETIVSSYFKSAHCVMFFYNITDRESFDKLETWFRYCVEHSAYPYCTKVVVALKADLEADRRVTTEEARQFCVKHDVPFFGEVTCTNRTQVDRLLFEVVSHALQALPQVLSRQCPPPVAGVPAPFLRRCAIS